MCCPSKTRSLLAPAIVGLLAVASSPSTHACGEATASLFALPGLPGFSLQVAALSEGGQIAGLGIAPRFTSSQAFLFAAGSTVGLGGLGGAFSQGVAVNSSGQVAGDATLSPSGATRHAFLATNGVLFDLGTLGGARSFAYAINDAGVVTGESTLANGMTSAFVYTNGVMSSLGTLGGTFSAGYVINQHGHIAGDSTTLDDVEGHAFFYTNGVMLDLGTLGGYYSTAFDVNDSGVVVGESALVNFDTHGFVFVNGVMQDVGTLGGTFSSAVAVNNSGQAIGVATTADDEATRGFVHANGVLTDLGTLGGDYVEPFAINNQGQIVGLATLSNGVQRAFLWEAGSMTDLNSLLPPGSGWELRLAQFINNAGRIVGVGKLNGVQQVFVLDLGSGGNNNPPVAVAGNDQSAECGGSVALDGSQSSDPDQDPLTYVWTLGGNVLSTNASFTVILNPGMHTFALQVADPCGLTATDAVIVTVADTTAPTIESAPQSANAVVGANCLAAVPDVTGSVVASDSCTPANQLVVGQSPAPGTEVAAGLHTITITVADAAGNVSTSLVALSVTDSAPPAITSVSASPSELSPPNNQPVSVAVVVAAADNCDPAPVSSIVSVTCNEAVAPGDIQITGASTVNLAARKGALGTTRVYTITVRTVDTSGNETIGSVTVTVPKNSGNGNGSKNKL